MDFVDAALKYTDHKSIRWPCFRLLKPSRVKGVLVFGIFLSNYRSQRMDLWVHGSAGRVEAQTPEALASTLGEYRRRNPDGDYSVKPISGE